ncbi:hypothetical protein JTE90_025113 [Oedothorax gibbosus]|uniref:C2H2-type domain-containing protein n=1 Tax=Oedothorax gibbosus TaxID=931172 RepID=A0AAV6U218_9ARAC|nr:hypothetical protein JTE90_025113 [Oedothorax gibbosus]
MLLFMPQPRRKKVVMSKCPHCTYQTMKLCNYQRHMRIHTGERPFKCYLCPKSFKENRDLRMHLVTHASGDGYLSGSAQPPKLANDSCENIYFGFKHSNVRSSAKQRKLHQCTYCPYTTIYSSHMQKHMFTHNGSKPFVCGVCGKAFTQKANLKVHAITHLRRNGNEQNGFKHSNSRSSAKQRKLHRCTYCPYTTIYSSHMQNHLFVHEGLKPFVCPVCGKGFTQKGSLKFHSITHLQKKWN